VAKRRDILDLSDAPFDAVERLLWLGGVADQVAAEMEPYWQDAYFDARLQGQLDQAETLGLHSHKRVMAYTRAANERRGRLIRWGDKRG
jgi:hypothetical protein